MDMTKILQNSIRAISPASTDGGKETQQESPFLNPFRRQSRLLHSPPLRQNGERSRTSPPELQSNKVPEKEVDAFTKLRDKISELVEMIGGRRRSIHQAMRDLMASISASR